MNNSSFLVWTGLSRNTRFISSLPKGFPTTRIADDQCPAYEKNQEEHGEFGNGNGQQEQPVHCK